MERDTIADVAVPGGRATFAVVMLVMPRSFVGARGLNALAHQELQ
jgi:hypothetical protein